MTRIQLKITCRFFTIALVYIILVNQVFSAEEILLFDSHILVNEDSSISVTENITVRAENKKINRGIYRDFPTSYIGKLGNKIKVGFEIVEVLKNGNSEPYHIKKMNNGIRVYIGDKNRRIGSGEYTYTLKYKTNQQLGFFESHDELYWNVTGNGWDFPILKAKANVRLPESIQSSDVSLEAYTGVIGSKEQNYKTSAGYSGNYLFETTRILRSNEGITIVVAWPKGHVSEPSSTQKFKLWLQANIASPLSIFSVLSLVLFYFLAWQKVGKDPEPGIIIPHYQPPKGFPPGGLRYIKEMGHDKQAFTAAVLSLAVKGYLKIVETGKFFELHRIKNTDIRLPAGENAILTNLFKNQFNKIELKNNNHTVISKAIKEHKKALDQEYSQSYFIHNRSIFFIGFAITLIIIAFIYLNLPTSDDKGSAFFLTFWLSIWTPFTVFLVYNWYTALRGKLTLSGIYSIGVSTIFAGAWSLGEIGALIALAAIIGIVNTFLIASLFFANILFYFLLKKPTLKGRKLLDEVDGFKKYLEVAEQEELNLRYPPKKTPKLFEAYLPYALALGVENQWAEKFTDVFNTKGANSAYQPSWYSGNNWNNNNLSSFTKSVGNTLSSAILSSSTAPGSSSGGGGGGSSGGGGGGGGGGGW